MDQRLKGKYPASVLFTNENQATPRNLFWAADALNDLHLPSTGYKPYNPNWMFLFYFVELALYTV